MLTILMLTMLASIHNTQSKSKHQSRPIGMDGLDGSGGLDWFERDVVFRRRRRGVKERERDREIKVYKMVYAVECMCYVCVCTHRVHG